MRVRGGLAALSGLAALAMAGCVAVERARAPFATAALTGPDGGARGSARLERGAGSATLAVDLTGLTPGPHGVHIHQAGRCDAPDFRTAGGHWNPTDAEHGRLNPRGPHAGDLGNVTADARGRVLARLALPMGGARLDRLLDADGAAVIVHSGADDERTDPGGDSGDRVACGVLEPPR